MEENHDEQHFTERELAGSQASATRRDQLFPLAIFEDLCKIIDTAKQSGDGRVHEGRSYALVLILVQTLIQIAPDFGIPPIPLIHNWDLNIKSPVLPVPTGSGSVI